MSKMNISPEVRRKMTIDRHKAEAQQIYGCECTPDMQSYICPANASNKCIHSSESMAELSAKLQKDNNR